jgi:hypothetical protein
VARYGEWAQREKAAGLTQKWAREGEWGWVWHTAKASKTGALLQKAAEDAAAKAVPGMTAAMKGMPAEWIPKWMEFWRVLRSDECGETARGRVCKKNGTSSARMR